MTKNIKLKLLALAAFFGLSALNLFATDTYADDQAAASAQLQVSPVSNQVVLKGGESLEYNFFVKNPDDSTVPASFKVYATPYAVTNEDYELSFSQENTHTQITRWIKFKDEAGNWVDSATFSVVPTEKKIITYKIDVPADVAAGGQYATIFVETINDDSASTANSTGIKTVSRAGIVLYGSTDGDTKEAPEITDYNFDTFLFSGDLKATARIANKGNTDFNGSYTYTIKNLFGKTLYEDTNTKLILPDTAWRVNTTWANSPFMGIFQTTFTVKAGSETTSETKVTVILPVFVIIIAILLLTTLIVWIIIFIRKRRERRSRMAV